MTPQKRPEGETPEQRVLRKAEDMRLAFIECGLVSSPDPHVSFWQLPPYRRERWIKLARAYVEIF
jgi:hypothetical protein